MAVVTIQTCDKCGGNIDSDNQSYFVATFHCMPRDPRALQEQFDFCIPCKALVVDFLKTPIGDELVEGVQDPKNELSDEFLDGEAPEPRAVDEDDPDG